MVEQHSATRHALASGAHIPGDDALDYIADICAELAEMAREQSAEPLAAALELARALALEALRRVQLAPDGKAAPEDAA